MAISDYSKVIKILSYIIITILLILLVILLLIFGSNSDNPNKIKYISIIIITILSLLLVIFLISIVYLILNEIFSIKSKATPGSWRQTSINYFQKFIEYFHYIVLFICSLLDATALYTFYTKDKISKKMIKLLGSFTIIWYIFWFWVIRKFSVGRNIKFNFFIIIILSLWSLIMFAVSYFLYIIINMESIHNCNRYEKVIVSFIIIDIGLLAILMVLAIYVYSGNLYKYITGVKDKVEEDDDEFPGDTINRIEERRSESNNAGSFSFF